MGNGNLCVSGADCYRNSVHDGVCAAAAGVIVDSITLAAELVANSFYFKGNIIAVGINTSTLGAADVAAAYAIMNAI